MNKVYRVLCQRRLEQGGGGIIAVALFLQGDAVRPTLARHRIKGRAHKLQMAGFGGASDKLGDEEATSFCGQPQHALCPQRGRVDCNSTMRTRGRRGPCGLRHTQEGTTLDREQEAGASQQDAQRAHGQSVLLGKDRIAASGAGRPVSPRPSSLATPFPISYPPQRVEVQLQNESFLGFAEATAARHATSHSAIRTGMDEDRGRGCEGDSALLDADVPGQRQRLTLAKELLVVEGKGHEGRGLSE
jgi:hypothetical protein